MTERDHRKGPSRLELAAICIYVILVTALLIRHTPGHIREAYRMVRSELARHAAMQQAEATNQPDNMNRSSMEE